MSSISSRPLKPGPMPSWSAAERWATAISWKEIFEPKNGSPYAKQILDEIGLDGRRLEMYHIGASDAPNWAKAVREMTERALCVGAESDSEKEDGRWTIPRPLTVAEARQAKV